MSQGLQTFNENGDVVLDITTRLTKQTVVGVASGSGSVLIPGFIAGVTRPFYMALYSPQPPYSQVPPGFSLNESNGVLSWSGGNISVDFIAGVY